MVDLVEQLREVQQKDFHPDSLKTMVLWGADEIERLREKYPYSELDIDMHVEAVTKELRAEIERLTALILDGCVVFEHYDLPEHAFHYRRELQRRALCPGGGYTGQPADESPTVDACLKAGVCGCELGAALTGKTP